MDGYQTKYGWYTNNIALPVRVGFDKDGEEEETLKSSFLFLLYVYPDF
jgi:hypothetical protein